MKQKLLSIFLVISTVYLGVQIIYTKSVPQGKNGYNYQVPIGDWAYLVGGILVCFGLYMMVMTFKTKEEP